MATAAPAPAMAVPLDQWARQKAPLSEAERASVGALADWLSPTSKSTASTSTAGAGARAAAAAVDRHAPNGSGKNADGAGRSSVAGEYQYGAVDEAEPGADNASRPTTSSSEVNDGAAGALMATLPSQPLTDAPSYLAWLGRQQARMLSSAQSRHLQGLHELSHAADEAQVLLDHLEAARVHIAELRAGAKSVEESSEDLRDEAETMVERIDHLSTLTEGLSLRLSYFAILPASTSFLSSPSLSLVTSNDFLLTLERLDVALAFVRAHPHYRDAALYKMRFEHCVVRAGTLARMYIMSRLNSLATEVGVRLKEWDRTRGTGKGKEREFDADNDPMMTLADPPVAALLYGRFDEETAQIQRLVFELERRASYQAPQATTDIGHLNSMTAPDDEASLLADYADKKDAVDSPDEGKADDQVFEVFCAPEFVTLLEECRTAYFEARRSILNSIVTACIGRIEVSAQNDASAGTHENAIVRLVTRAMPFLASAGRAELELYNNFFNSHAHERQSRQGLGNYLKSLSSPLDDRLRPRIAKEASIASLSSVCEAFSESVDQEDASIAAVTPYIAALSVAEAQERLVSLARATIAGARIALFSATDESLDYPAKLKKSHRRAPSIGGAGLLEAAADQENVQRQPLGFKQVDGLNASSASSVRLFASPPKHVLSTWYPPLASTLELLAQMSTAIPSNVFVGLADSAIDACRANVMAAGSKMASQGGLGAGRIGASSRMDVPLFLLRHLLLLREMTASVDLRQASRTAFAVDRRATGAGLEDPATAGRGLDFARLVETLNSLWNGLRGSAAAGNASIMSPSTERPSVEQSNIPLSARTAVERDLENVRTQLVDVVAQGVALPLRVYIDQRARARAASISSPTQSPIKENEPSPITSPARPHRAPRTSISGAGSTSPATKARSALQAFETCAKTNLGEASEALRLYIEDPRAIDSLVQPIVAKILETYEGFNHCLQEVGIEASELPALRTPELCESMLLAQLPTSSPAVLTAMQPAVTPTAAAGV